MFYSIVYFDWEKVRDYIDELVQEKCNSIANALVLRLSCTNPWILTPLGEDCFRGIWGSSSEVILKEIGKMGCFVQASLCWYEFQGGVLGLLPGYEGGRYSVTTSLIGWVQA